MSEHCKHLHAKWVGQFKQTAFQIEFFTEISPCFPGLISTSVEKNMNDKVCLSGFYQKLQTIASAYLGFTCYVLKITIYVQKLCIYL